MSLPRPFPSGWYCVGLSRELSPGAIQSRRFVGAEVVVFRTRSGAVSVIDAYCPHLGSHLGQGTIEGEAIQCSFHRFRFDGAGRCVATGYGGRAPNVAVRTWPVEEKNGLILAYHDPEGAAPGWSVPALDSEGWTPLLTRVWRQRGHPQETTETSVDVGHFAGLHGFADVEKVREVDATGPCLTAQYRMKKRVKLAGMSFGRVAFEFDVSVHGLGYSFVETRLPSSKVRLRHFVLACPTEEDEIELRIALSMANHRVPLANQLIPRLAFRSFVSDVVQDLENWRTKRYLARPILVEGDGPIRMFRRWAEQFYATAAE
jgi:phenylpropionate dioxygenase-like ring-hydroxylating dioxygenase large terminal subunit